VKRKNIINKKRNPFAMLLQSKQFHQRKIKNKKKFDKEKNKDYLRDQ